MATEWNEGAIVGAAVVATIGAIVKLVLGWLKHRDDGTSVLITQEEKHFGYYQQQLSHCRGRVRELEVENTDLRDGRDSLDLERHKVATLEYKLRDLAYYTVQLDALAREDRDALIAKGVDVNNIPPPPRWVRDFILSEQLSRNEPGHGGQ